MFYEIWEFFRLLALEVPFMYLSYLFLRILLYVQVHLIFSGVPGSKISEPITFSSFIPYKLILKTVYWPSVIFASFYSTS